MRYPVSPGPGFNRTYEVCAGKKNDYPQMRVYEQKKKSGGKLYYNKLQSRTNYVNTHGPIHLYLIFEKLSLKNQVRKIKFEKSSSEWTKNLVYQT